MAPFPVAFFIIIEDKKKYVKYIVGHYTIFLDADKMIVELCKMHKKCDKKRDIMTEMIFHVDKMKEKD